MKKDLKGWVTVGHTNSLTIKSKLDRQTATLEAEIPKIEGQLLESETKLAKVREKLVPFTEQKKVIDLDIQSMDSSFKTKIEKIRGITVYLTIN